MKKLSRTAWLVLGIGVFVIAFASLYMLYYQQGSEQRQLNDSLVLAQTTTSTVASEKGDTQSQLTQLKGALAQLETELIQVKSRLNSSQSIFPKKVESIEYGERLFSIANGWGLDITMLTSSESKTKAVEDISFSVTILTATVKGQVDDILGFVNTIVMDPSFTNATVEVVDLSVPKPLTEEEIEKMREEGATEEEIEEEEESRTPSATITLDIYSY